MSAAVPLTTVQTKHKYRTVFLHRTPYTNLFPGLDLTTTPSYNLIWVFFRDKASHGSPMDLDFESTPLPVLKAKDNEKNDVVAIKFKGKNYKVRYEGQTRDFLATRPEIHLPHFFIDYGKKRGGILMRVTDYNSIRSRLGLGPYQPGQRGAPTKPARPKRPTGVRVDPGPSEPHQTRSRTRRAAGAAGGAGPSSPRPMSRSPSQESLDLRPLEDFPSPGRSSQESLDLRPLIDYDELPGSQSSISDMSEGALQEADNIAGPGSPRAQFIRNLGYYRTGDPRLFARRTRFGRKQRSIKVKDLLKRLMKDLKKLKKVK
jgi:hypothetical protein